MKATCACNAIRGALRPGREQGSGGKDLDTPDAKIRFSNIHYFAAGATVFGAEAQGAYMYDGKEYAGQNMHAEETGKVNKCQDCHDVHALEANLESCETCHETGDTAAIRGESSANVDYDGDGDVTEGVKGEIDTLAEALFARFKRMPRAKALRSLTTLMSIRTSPARMARRTPVGLRACLRLRSITSMFRKTRARMFTTRSL